ncbi:MAG: acetyl-CoA acetyltransferase [Candidatus Aldehydirespiratoraceae bacterium]|jgi:acetyl-CoA acetyltransferase
MSDRFEHDVVLSGIGKSAVGRRVDRDPLALVRDAVDAALADAGLTLADIDGLSTAPGPLAGPPMGYSVGGIETLTELLGLQPTWFTASPETMGHAGPIIDAALAVSGGLCRHVLSIRAQWEGSHRKLMAEGAIPPPGGGGRQTGRSQWHSPFGAMSPANWIAMQATNHMETFGTTREQLGALALNARANAARNPDAIYRDPLTMDDYLSARLVSTPFGLYDCDVPCDGVVAVIVSHVDTVPDLRQPPVRLEAVGTAMSERFSWDQGTMVHEPMVAGPAAHVWTRTDLKPADVDVAQLYDGFTFNCLSWLEALGFCEIGEGGPFVEGGQRISLDGELPLNTSGGQLSEGRLNGFGLIHEAIVQLRDAGGDHQVPGHPEVSLVSTGGGHPGGVLLLTRWR